MSIDSSEQRQTMPLGGAHGRERGLAASALTHVLADFLARGLPHRRVARLTGLLHLAEAPIDSGLAQKTASRLLSSQQGDGGWVDCEDTAWSCYALRCLGQEVPDAQSWLASERSGPAWGYCRRDSPCIPITATIALLVPSLWDYRSAEWLTGTWERDLGGRYQLSYKAAWYLLASLALDSDTRLVERTHDHLLADQRADGGWGPWRTHPAPTDSFTTGIAMWALTKHPRPEKVNAALRRAAAYCAESQLTNGLFPTHYIEEGSAWLLLGWNAATRLITCTSAG